jgi:hypothetical protein
MLHDISAQRIQQSIDTLVSFGTRHTLSSQTDPNRGIGAATNWVFDQFQQAAAASEGRMTVERQTFVQPPGPRNPDPVVVTNVIATLHGTQPESADRTYGGEGNRSRREQERRELPGAEVSTRISRGQPDRLPAHLKLWQP